MKCLVDHYAATFCSALVIAISLVAVGCAGESNPESRAELPEYYGLYLLEEDSWERPSEGYIHGSNEIHFLLFDAVVRETDFDEESYLELLYNRSISQVIAKNAPTLNDPQSSEGEGEQLVQYFTWQVEEFTTSLESCRVRLRVKPIESSPDKLIFSVAGLPNGDYVLSASGETFRIKIEGDVAAYAPLHRWETYREGELVSGGIKSAESARELFSQSSPSEIKYKSSQDLHRLKSKVGELIANLPNEDDLEYTHAKDLLTRYSRIIEPNELEQLEKMHESLALELVSALYAGYTLSGFKQVVAAQEQFKNMGLYTDAISDHCDLLHSKFFLGCIERDDFESATESLRELIDKAFDSSEIRTLYADHAKGIVTPLLQGEKYFAAMDKLKQAKELLPGNVAIRSLFSNAEVMCEAYKDIQLANYEEFASDRRIAGGKLREFYFTSIFSYRVESQKVELHKNGLKYTSTDQGKYSGEIWFGDVARIEAAEEKKVHSNFQHTYKTVSVPTEAGVGNLQLARGQQYIEHYYFCDLHVREPSNGIVAAKRSFRFLSKASRDLFMLELVKVHSDWRQDKVEFIEVSLQVDDDWSNPIYLANSPWPDAPPFSVVGLDMMINFSNYIEYVSGVTPKVGRPEWLQLRSKGVKVEDIRFSKYPFEEPVWRNEHGAVVTAPTYETAVEAYEKASSNPSGRNSSHNRNATQNLTDALLRGIIKKAID